MTNMGTPPPPAPEGPNRSGLPADSSPPSPRRHEDAPRRHEDVVDELAGMQKEQFQKLVRVFSNPSGKAVSTLADFAREYMRIVDVINGIEQAFLNKGVHPDPNLSEVLYSPGKCITELSLVEARANKLQDRVDSVDVSELGSGKDYARSIRRAMVGKLDALDERIRLIFKRLTAAKKEDEQDEMVEQREEEEKSVSESRCSVATSDESESVSSAQLEFLHSRDESRRIGKRTSDTKSGDILGEEADAGDARASTNGNILAVEEQEAKRQRTSLESSGPGNKEPPLIDLRGASSSASSGGTTSSCSSSSALSSAAAVDTMKNDHENKSCSHQTSSTSTSLRDQLRARHEARQARDEEERDARLVAASAQQQANDIRFRAQQQASRPRDPFDFSALFEGLDPWRGGAPRNDYRGWF